MAYMGDGGGTERVLIGKPEEKRQHERPRPRWQNNTKTDRKANNWDGVDWMNFCQGSEVSHEGLCFIELVGASCCLEELRKTKETALSVANVPAEIHYVRL